MNTAAPQTTPSRDTIRVPWGVLAVVLGLLAPGVIWGSSLAISIAGGGVDDLSDAEIVANVIAQVVLLDGLLIAIPAGVALWRYHAGWSSLGLRPFDMKLWWWPIVGTIGALVLVYVYALIAILIAGDAPNQDVEELFESRAVLPLVGFAVIVAAPVAEEIFFRGFVFAGLVRPLGAIPAIIVSGLIFGVPHITNAETVALVLPIGAVGALFAWLYYRTGSLWPSIVTHMLFNAVGFGVGAGTSGAMGLP